MCSKSESRKIFPGPRIAGVINRDQKIAAKNSRRRREPPELPHSEEAKCVRDFQGKFCSRRRLHHGAALSLTTFLSASAELVCRSLLDYLKRFFFSGVSRFDFTEHSAPLAGPLVSQEAEESSARHIHWTKTAAWNARPTPQLTS